MAINGLNETCGLLVNSSRGIIYASNKSDFDQEAGEVSERFNNEWYCLRQKELFNVVPQYLQAKTSVQMDYFNFGAGGSSAIWFKGCFFFKIFQFITHRLTGPWCSQGLIQNPFKNRYSLNH